MKPPARQVGAALLMGLVLLSPLAVLADDVVLGMTRGDVRVRPAGGTASSPAGKGQALQGGDRVLTGRDGWVTLLLPDGSRLVLTADSEFVVQEHDAKRRAGAFALITGMMRARIAPPPRSAPMTYPDYRFNTPTAVAGIRGTDFSLLHLGQANVFFGNHGKVEVEGINTLARPLTAATVVQTTRGLTPIQPIPVEPGSRLAEAQALLNAVTETPPASWAEAGKLPEMVVQWNLGYGRTLAAEGRQDEALHVLLVAQDLAEAIKARTSSTEEDRVEMDGLLAQIEAARRDQATTQSLQRLYADFAAAYQAKALKLLTGFLSQDWKAADGADVADLEDNLSNSFRVFDRIQFAIGHLDISPLDAGRFQVSYSVTITGQIHSLNLVHHESSNVTDIVVLTPDGPRIQSTQGGNLWLQ